MEPGDGQVHLRLLELGERVGERHSDQRSGQRYGISSACVGGGQGMALLIENLAAA